MAAFNQASYHNLYDIWNFLSNNATYSAWFAKRGNPCSACHDSHLAKRNWDSRPARIPPGERHFQARDFRQFVGRK